MIAPDKTFLVSKWGPLPAWVWMVVGLGFAVVVSSYRKNKAAAAQAQTAQSGPSAGDLAQNMPPQVTFVDNPTTLVPVTVQPQPVTVPITVTPPTVPPAGGAPPPTHPPVPSPVPRPVPPPPVTVTRPAPPPPPPPAPSGFWSSPLVRYRNGSELSSLWALASHYYGNGNLWQQIWSAPQNATLRARAGNNPRNVQPGWSFWIPK